LSEPARHGTIADHDRARLRRVRGRVDRDLLRLQERRCVSPSFPGQEINQ
jgi:hypothetical protein